VLHVVELEYVLWSRRRQVSWPIPALHFLSPCYMRQRYSSWVRILSETSHEFRVQDV